MNIKEEKARRLLFLNHLYDTVESDETTTVKASELGNELKLNREEWQRIVQYLNSERLIKWVAQDIIAMSHQGVKEIEEARSNPNKWHNY